MPKIILIDIHIHFLKPKLWHKTTYKQTIIIKFASFAAIKKKKKESTFRESVNIHNGNKSS